MDWLHIAMWQIQFEIALRQTIFCSWSECQQNLFDNSWKKMKIPFSTNNVFNVNVWHIFMPSFLLVLCHGCRFSHRNKKQNYHEKVDALLHFTIFEAQVTNLILYVDSWVMKTSVLHCHITSWCVWDVSEFWLCIGQWLATVYCNKTQVTNSILYDYVDNRVMIAVGSHLLTFYTKYCVSYVRNSWWCRSESCLIQKKVAN